MQELMTNLSYNKYICLLFFEFQFCYIRSHHNCQTQYKQISVFKRNQNSSRWIPQVRNITVGCGCVIGFNYLP